MAQPRVRITKRMIDAIVPNGNERLLRDSEVLGFGFRISPEGQMTYILRYRIDGVQRRYKIGVHGSPWTPEAARAEAQVLLGKVAEGIDPQEIKIAQRKELTIGELCDAYLAEGLLTAKQTSIDTARKDIENHIKPRIGRRRASKITRAHVEQLLREIAEGKTRKTRKTGHRGLSRTRGGKGAANKAVSTLSAALGFGAAFNNAGIEGAPASTAECTVENFDRVVAVNLRGVWLCMRAEIPLMLRHSGGAIVNCASVAGLIGLPNIPAYVASKHGVVGLTRAAALEYARQGIRVNAVCPGAIETPMLDRYIAGSPDGRKQMERTEPIGRIGTPVEIAAAVVWLCSSGASFTTGQALAVDGGWTAG